MFDLSRDLPAVDEEQEDVNVANGISKEVSLKRKRQDNDEESKASNPWSDTGAGSKIPNAELGIGIGRQMRENDGADAAAGQWINLDPEQDLSSDDERSYTLANESDLALVKLRRGNSDINGHVDNLNHAEISENDDARVAKIRERPAYWHTYKYRPILGIVPLGSETDAVTAAGGEDDDLLSGLEVALVERPLFDVDLPPRYSGNQEWDQ